MNWFPPPQYASFVLIMQSRAYFFWYDSHQLCGCCCWQRDAIMSQIKILWRLASKSLWFASSYDRCNTTFCCFSARPAGQSELH